VNECFAAAGYTYTRTCISARSLVCVTTYCKIGIFNLPKEDAFFAVSIEFSFLSIRNPALSSEQKYKLTSLVCLRCHLHVWSCKNGISIGLLLVRRRAKVPDSSPCVTYTRTALRVNPLTPELNPSAQRSMTRFYYWGFCFLNRAFH
jgi:hypothetical protein